jgi:3-hydroxybutyrate dehydrogenase
MPSGNDMEDSRQVNFKEGPMGRVAVVTGAASGIGRAIAERLARGGDQVVVADIQAERGQAVARSIGGLFLCLDLRRREDCRRLIAETLERFGALHILINNAGFQHIDPIEAFPEEIWEAMLAVMLTAPFLLIKYAWPAMKAQRWGRIVNIASIHGLVASPFKSAYVAAKHGLIGLTRVAALEGGPYGITANAICPAYVRTPLVENQIQDQARMRGLPPEEVVEKIMLEPAAIRRLIEPEEVAALVAYLCSEEASAVTGAAWTIDLGWTAR